MRLSAIRKRLAEEGGYTMIAVIGAISLVSMLAAATLAASNGDVNEVQRYLDHRRAHAAAQAGIADYSFHLNNDNSYWSRCTGVPEPNAVNQVGSTAKRRSVPGPSGESYAIELLPATGKSSCDPTKPVESMLEQSGANTGSFRIRSTGYADGAKASVVATYKRASLLDYIYFTQYETSDPVTYGDQETINAAYAKCVKFRREGRESETLPGGQTCTRIVFVSGDEIKGPLHTNDDLAICGNPKFGRNAADTIEVGASPKGWIDGGCSGYGTANPEFIGPLVTTAPVLKPPSTNARLLKIAGPEYTYSCQTEIKLEGTKMTVTTNGKGKVTNVPFPASGVIYIQNGSCPDLTESGKNKPWPACSSAYSPFKATYSIYPEGSDCGTAVVSGNYSGELTIAAENNIVIGGEITKNEGTQGLLGLIANNFVRVKHPFCRDKKNGETGGVEGCPANKVPAETGKNECGSGSDSTGTMSNLKIEAAILAIEHTFIVDHYDCGSSLGTLTVKGAISQKFRGPVGTTAGTGYIKSYEYDNRLRYMEPPNFLDPVEPAWHIQRETLDYP
jgi:type II secretory pathway pseudopilin PulG